MIAGEQSKLSLLANTTHFIVMHRPSVRSNSTDHQPHLVIVTSRFLPDLGGVQTHVVETSQRLLAQGWQVTIITGVEPSESSSKSRQNPWQWLPDSNQPTHAATIIPIHYDFVVGVGLLQIWGQMLQLLPVLRRATYIHVHDVLWWLLPARLLLPLSPVVLTMHGWEGRFPIPAKLKFIKRLGAVLSDKVMTIGDFIGQYYGIRPDGVSYGAVSSQVLAALANTPAKKSTKHHQLRIAFVGRLAPDTGLREILAAIPSLTQYEWHFYGDGPLREACERWGTVHGWLVTKPWLVEADILIGSGYLSVWEALLAGKQVVVYADNRLKVDYFRHAPFAAYIELTTNREKFIAALTKTRSTQSEAELQKQILSARALAQQHQWDKIIAVYVQWYQEIKTYSWWQLLVGRWRHLRFEKHELVQALGNLALVYVFGVLALVMLSGFGLWLGLSTSPQSPSQQRWFSMANQTAQTTSILTAHRLSPIELLSKTSSVVLGTAQIMAQLTQGNSADQQTGQVTAAALDRVLTDGSDVADAICQHQTRLPLDAQQRTTLQNLCQVLPQTQAEWMAAQAIAQAIFSDRLELLIVMQNSQELRATGGFMGSYARIQFNQLVPDYEIGDIYEPDGQFQGHIAAPAGVDEYLSSGKGLRLPDANWFPDFPTSAQTILKYFAYGKRQGVDGVIAINLPVFEKLLTVLGPVSLPDYDLVVTADNFAQVARADRKNFFPGSQQKPHFLTALANQVRFRLESASVPEKIACAQILLESLKQQDIQLYLIDEELQSEVDILGWSGRQQLPPGFNQDSQSLYFMSVESNVGINKANRAIQRQVVLDLSARSLLVQLKLKNQNSPDMIQGTQQEVVNGMGYVNYQRIYVSPFFIVKQITIDGQTVPSWHEQLIQTDADITLNQIGFVLPVPVGEERTALVRLELDKDQTQVVDLTLLNAVFIQKQAGLPTVEYIIQAPDSVSSHKLVSHTLIPLKK
jgi:glycosyltransferase involved in cell wall biosynthesis